MLARVVSNEKRVFLVAGKRTPFGKFGDSLKDISPVDLAVIAAKASLAETNIDPKKIEHVVLGNVIPSTTDTMYGARHLGLKVGTLIETPAYNVNRLCGSGIQAIVDAANLIRRGECNLVLAAGTENMSLAPHLTYGGRFGTRYGPLEVVDMLSDALTDKYTKIPMAITAENLAQEYKISRDDCDKYSKQSHERASAAYANNYLQGELAPVTLKKGELTKDQHLREKVSLEDMAKLRPSFQKDGTVTAGSASRVVDGAGIVFVASEEFVEKEGLTPLAEIGEYAVKGVDPSKMGIGPVPAINALLEKIGGSLNDMDLVEINEAFAAQVLSCAKALNLDQQKLNIWGGAISIGHPLGASGVRISLTLARQLKELKLKQGIASACIGGGQGIALHLKAVN